MAKNVNEIKVQEILAYILYATFNDVTLTAAATSWRKDPQLREAWRASAEALTRDLEDVGVKVAVKSSDALDKCVRELATEPATRVYNLEDEVGGQPTYGEVLDNPVPE